MQSRAIRICSSLLAIAALAGAATYAGRSERALAARHGSLRSFELLTHEALMRLNDIRYAQQAYVVAGQSTKFWVPKVAALLPETTATIDTLRPLAASEAARQALDDAAQSLTDLAGIDKRARDYLAVDQPLMAADVLFTEARETAAEAGRLIEAARFSDQQELDALQAFTRRRQATVAASAAGVAGVVLLWLAVPGRRRVPAAATLSDHAPAESAERQAAVDAGLPAVDSTPSSSSPSATIAAPAEDQAETPDTAAIALEAAARVSTEFGCVQNTTDLRRVLARAAEVLDASGLVVWLGSTAGADLRAVAAYGYSDQVLGLMRAVPRHADNAAAAAYRLASLQIVPAKPGTSLGAVVVPIISAEGCIGALTAEIRDNREISETVHAVATIFASQLSGVLATSAQETSTSPKAAAS